MKKKTALIAVSCAFALSAALLAGCSSEPADDAAADGDGAASAVAVYQLAEECDALSLQATHDSSVLEGKELTTSYCLSCHPDSTIIPALEGYTGDGEKDVFNPHAAHVVYECVDCHDGSGQPELQCNSCHQLDVRDGWTAADGWGSDVAFGDSARSYTDAAKIYEDLGYGVDGSSYMVGYDGNEE